MLTVKQIDGLWCVVETKWTNADGMYITTTDETFEVVRFTGSPSDCKALIDLAKEGYLKLEP